MPQLPQVYSRITAGIGIVPLVTKACKRCLIGISDVENVIWMVWWLHVTNGQIVTLFVSLCRGRRFSGISEIHLRQVVGRYFASRVLGVHLHSMLPAWVIGDSSRYVPLLVIAALAFGPLNNTLTTPFVTSTLET
jgi:hypothetical protein